MQVAALVAERRADQAVEPLAGQLVPLRVDGRHREAQVLAGEFVAKDHARVDERREDGQVGLFPRARRAADGVVGAQQERAHGRVLGGEHVPQLRLGIPDPRLRADVLERCVANRQRAGVRRRPRPPLRVEEAVEVAAEHDDSRARLEDEGVRQRDQRDGERVAVGVRGRFQDWPQVADEGLLRQLLEARLLAVARHWRRDRVDVRQVERARRAVAAANLEQGAQAADGLFLRPGFRERLGHGRVAHLLQLGRPAFERLLERFAVGEPDLVGAGPGQELLERAHEGELGPQPALQLVEVGAVLEGDAALAAVGQDRVQPAAHRGKLHPRGAGEGSAECAAHFRARHVEFVARLQGPELRLRRERRHSDQGGRGRVHEHYPR